MREPAEQPCSALARVNLAEAIDHLSWLCPSAGALTALGRLPVPQTWPSIRHDPAAVILLLRQAEPTLPACLDSPRLFRDVLGGLDGADNDFVDWTDPGVGRVYETGFICATLCEALAQKTERCDPNDAWIAGLLAPLGWYAARALDPESASSCLNDPELTAKPAATQRRWWGIDAPALARRLVRRWSLPPRIGAVVSHLALPPETAVDLGADPTLFRLVRLAVRLARDHGHDLGLACGDRNADAAAVGLLPEDVARVKLPELPLDMKWENPRGVPLLRDLLAVAAENRGLREGRLRRETEAEADRLHDALENRAQQEGAHLQACKLASLAEFAAGAGHEINNPLAVISGEAQYVLGHAAQWLTAEAGDAARRSLQTIVNQTKRVHGMLRDLMQFARPRVPQHEWFDIAELLAEVAAGLSDLAKQRRVRLEVNSESTQATLRADREQVKTALTCLLRNAVEAAPPEGWARIGLHGPHGARMTVTIEDSGPGPDETQRPHLFDPFYSGRSAGRGRGLGLPTAWRLARLQGGDVRLDTSKAGSPTCFILELPWSSPPDHHVDPVVPSSIFTDAVTISGMALNGCQRG